MSKNLLSILAYLFAAAAMAGLLLFHHLRARGPYLLGIQVAAVLLFLWARMTFGSRSFHAAATPSEGALVTTGPYRYWRHPIYASIIYFIWAGQAHAPAAIPLALATIASFALFARMLLEEQFLTRAYPEYPEYAKKAKRLIPLVY